MGIPGAGAMPSSVFGHGANAIFLSVLPEGCKLFGECAFSFLFSSHHHCPISLKELAPPLVRLGRRRLGSHPATVHPRLGLFHV